MSSSSINSSTSVAANTSAPAKQHDATHGTSVSALMAAHGTVNAPQIVDVRREAKYLESPSMIIGAIRIPPEAIARTTLLTRGQPVLVYCVYGHEVGMDAAKSLRDAGYVATFLEGGIEEWRERGGAVALGGVASEASVDGK